MKTVTTSKGTFMFVEVPDNIYNLKLTYHGNIQYELDNPRGIGSLMLHPYVDKEIIGQISTITEDQAIEVVDDCPYYCKCWKNYSPEIEYFVGLEFNSKISCWSAKQSLHSLIKSEGLDPAKDYVILKINK